VSTVSSVSPPDTGARIGPPVWLIGATALLAIGCLAMAVAETSLWMHYLIDAGESISLVGVGVILAAGLYLYGRRRLLVSLPLVLPWLLFPVITQGDQIIDNLSINWMRLVSHVLLGALFGMPVLIVVLGVRYAVRPRTGAAARPVPGWLAIVPGLRQIADGRTREGGAALAAVLLVAEMWVAARFLGLLMIVTLIVMVWGVLAYGSSAPPERREHARIPERSERFALAMLLAGVVASLGLFVGFKNRPGAYQGSPSYYMDPSQPEAGFKLDPIAIPVRPVAIPASADALRASLTGYARAFEQLLAGYYVLDRNYNYHFHNELFLRSTPLLDGYRRVGLTKIREAEALRAAADRVAAGIRPSLDATDPFASLLDDVKAYAAFTFERAPVLERMSGEFERTPAGLQHATHLYEGEGKVLGVRLAEILAKHEATLSSPAAAPVTNEFASISRAVHDAYANRIVGF
jgi:hypothetical protein